MGLHQIEEVGDMMTAYLERHNDEKNLHRFWAISIERNLFGGWSVIRTWGRVDSSSGRQTIDMYDELAEAQRAFQKKERQKLGRGYRRV